MLHITANRLGHGNNLLDLVCKFIKEHKLSGKSIVRPLQYISLPNDMYFGIFVIIAALSFCTFGSLVGLCFSQTQNTIPVTTPEQAVIKYLANKYPPFREDNRKETDGLTHPFFSTEAIIDELNFKTLVVHMSETRFF